LEQAVPGRTSEDEFHVCGTGYRDVSGTRQGRVVRWEDDVVAAAVVADDPVSAVQREPCRICRPLRLKAKRASQVPWCGLPMVMSEAIREGSSWRAYQALAAKPPMLWATITGGRPVHASMRRTASSMAGT